MNWQTGKAHGSSWQYIDGKACQITLEPRPHYCDRGSWIAKIHARGSIEDQLKLNLDEQDMWPRYYFDETRAKLEIEAWLTKRGQAL